MPGGFNFIISSAWLINLHLMAKEYEIIEKIGEGISGIVFKGCDPETQQIVAVKTIFFHEHGGVPSSVIREIAILKVMDHPNIVKMLDVQTQDNIVNIVFEYIESDLLNFLESAPLMTQSPEVVKRFLHNILSGVLYLHRNNIVHRDLKTDNMLIDSADSDVKLADFGFSREIDIHLRSLTKQVGNIDNMAPEVLLGSDKYSTPSDIWAVGCVFAEIVMGRRLFGERGHPYERLNDICRILGTPNEEMWPEMTLLFPVVSTRRIFPPKNLAEVVQGLEPAGINLLSNMLRWNPSDRITAAEALKHEYFHGIQGHM
ncbi:B2-type cyclin dependent kinase [Heracleum sosnowskyi]|uniref:cyclin-dependent kinase n=1 Tax=Heracleum sosnowskyi TaxID=360622 RepID=A0AAD8IB04_9APIA|nr:B2-type cyclin dependent kinase [Heracleum sosnowskyi]